RGLARVRDLSRGAGALRAPPQRALPAARGRALIRLPHPLRSALRRAGAGGRPAHRPAARAQATRRPSPIPRVLGFLARLVSRIGPFAGALLALALAARAAAAHDQPFSYLDLRLEGRAVEGRILAHVVDLARATGSAVPDSLLDSAFAAARAETLESALARRLAIRADGVALRPAWTGIERVP